MFLLDDEERKVLGRRGPRPLADRGDARGDKGVYSSVYLHIGR